MIEYPLQVPYGYTLELRETLGGPLGTLKHYSGPHGIKVIFSHDLNQAGLAHFSVSKKGQPPTDRVVQEVIAGFMPGWKIHSEPARGRARQFYLERGLSA